LYPLGLGLSQEIVCINIIMHMSGNVKDQALCLINFFDFLFLLFSFYTIAYLSISMYLTYLYFLRNIGGMSKKTISSAILFFYIPLYLFINLSIHLSFHLYLSLLLFSISLPIYFYRFLIICLSVYLYLSTIYLSLIFGGRLKE
jgi:hypothetical protein